jgi:predicted metal-dependent hydrolase
MIKPTISKQLYQYGDQKIEYNLVRSKRRKTSELIVDGNEITLRIPFNKSIRDAERIVGRKIKWVVRKQKEYREQIPEISKPYFSHGSTLPYLGKNYVIQIRTATENRIELEEDKFLVILNLKTSSQKSDVSDVNKVKSLYNDWLYHQARKIFEDKVKNFSDLIDVRPKKIVLKNLKNRWGSVTKHGTVNLNYNLAKAPEDVIDYIIIHELCHFHIKEHSHHFWSLLKKYMSDYKTRIDWLEVNGRYLV